MKKITLQELIIFLKDGIDTYNEDKNNGTSGDLSEYIQDQIEDYLDGIDFEEDVLEAVKNIENSEIDGLDDEDREKFLSISLRSALERQNMIEEYWNDFIS